MSNLTVYLNSKSSILFYYRLLVEHENCTILKRCLISTFRMAEGQKNNLKRKYYILVHTTTIYNCNFR